MTLEKKHIGGNEIDRLMHEDPLNLSAQDYDEIIAHIRHLRAIYQSGVKPKKHTEPVDLVKIGLVSSTPELKRRRLD